MVNSGTQLKKDIAALKKEPLVFNGKKYGWGDLINHTNTHIFKNLANGKLNEQDSSKWNKLDKTAIKLYFYYLQS